MVKTVIIILIGLGAWNYYEQNTKLSQIAPTTPPERIANIASFACDGRQHCSQMSSYEEAVFFIKNCPNTKMDGDHDGIPCERQFGH